ncbi:molybdopterin biosynthesis MoaE protein [Archaeoglobus veneficus SNP6]|uniref:Molybdopterin biosynthesis MoaE protein n=1 Tax=Archaeoglobus veneficus (strain DSM 11195 / SNP6) TaxID=693661 RepID=F2KNM8_ARCVS|nr:molybdenum cofactor biosynthesis protein MoaE [Archaeoglobus veneficus]AEA46256.1 molybdopterin biosynthesis MoaE protein [Archaeoglobus veneficus SNP6]
MGKDTEKGGEAECMASGRVAIVERDGELIKTDVGTFKADRVNLKNVLDFLADLGYDCAILKGFDDFEASEWETLKSLVEKVKRSEGSERCGAIGIFVGFVRKISDGKEVERLEYEKYDELYTEKLIDIEEKLKSYPGVVEVKIHHRDGILKPGEDIVYVVIMGGHRKDVWKPLEDSMELIKKELPIWKKEVFTDGEHWVHDG